MIQSKTMKIRLNEPSNFKYIYIAPETNNIHLLLPIIAGVDVSTDNTCQADFELRTFFEKGAFNELESYKRTLELHLSLIQEDSDVFRSKRKQLEQISIYIEAIVNMKNSYKPIIDAFLSKPSNLFSIQLRPKVQDPVSQVVSPIFNINRYNDNQGTPLSPLYNKMHEVFPGIALGKPDPLTDLISNVLKLLPPGASFNNIKQALKAQCAEQFKIDIDIESWINADKKESISQENVDSFMGFYEGASTEDYIHALLGICAPNLWGIISDSPFYLGVYDNQNHKAESLSMMTQFFLGVLNVYCRTKAISHSNFGVILDSSHELSQKLVEVVTDALSRGEEVEPAMISYFNLHLNEFKISRELNADDRDTIVQKFQNTYRTVTATKENPHMDDFMFLDSEAKSEQTIFFSHKGLISTDASHIIPITPENQAFLAEIRREAVRKCDILTPQCLPVLTVNIAPETLLKILENIQWDKLPKEVVKTFLDLPDKFKIRQILYCVAKGNQEEVIILLESFENQQKLLQTPGKFTDYSGRTFTCTAYEYAFWAKDTHMLRMLEQHMDDETKALMLEKIQAIELSGLEYEQHGVSYQNTHYDMSFILKNLNVQEFEQLKQIVGESHSKIQHASADNYKQISFSATEYELLKTTLKNHEYRFIFSLFFTSPATVICNKLKFDFFSLHTAYKEFLSIISSNKPNYDQMEVAWLNIGKAQRDVPAHVAQEFCRKDRPFYPIPSFREPYFPRSLMHILKEGVKPNKCWFPLTNSDLGYSFTMFRGMADYCLGNITYSGPGVKYDFQAFRKLDEIRTAELSTCFENLSPNAKRLGMGT